MRKLFAIILVALAMTLALAGTASAAGAKDGFLLVSVLGGAQNVPTPPGQAKQVVAANCPGTVLNIAVVRNAFPNFVLVCPNVTVRSQVAAT